MHSLGRKKGEEVSERFRRSENRLERSCPNSALFALFSVHFGRSVDAMYWRGQLYVYFSEVGGGGVAAVCVCCIFFVWSPR